MSRSEYDRINVTCLLLDELLDQKIEFQITPYERSNIFCELIYDMNNKDQRYLYEGCIDMDVYEEK